MSDKKYVGDSGQESQIRRLIRRIVARSRGGYACPLDAAIAFDHYNGQHETSTRRGTTRARGRLDRRRRRTVSSWGSPMNIAVIGGLERNEAELTTLARRAGHALH